MATYNDYTSQTSSSSQRLVAMVLALVAAVVLSPVYINPKNDKFRTTRNYDSKWSSAFELPMLLAALIVAIKTTKNNNSASTIKVVHRQISMDSHTLRTGSSSLGLAAILVTLAFVLSWQNSAHRFFWK